MLWAVEDFPPGCPKQAWVGDGPVALYNLDGALFATSDEFTHGSGTLSEGLICGDEVECPMHMGRFDIRTGKATRAPCVESLRTFLVQTRGGRVLVQANSPSGR